MALAGDIFLLEEEEPIIQHIQNHGWPGDKWRGDMGVKASEDMILVLLCKVIPISVPK